MTNIALQLAFLQEVVSARQLGAIDLDPARKVPETTQALALLEEKGLVREP